LMIVSPGSRHHRRPYTQRPQRNALHSSSCMRARSEAQTWSRPSYWRLVPPEGSLNALAPQRLSSARRPKRGFSGSPREASRCHQERGTSKRSRPHPCRPSGAPKGWGRGAPAGNFAIPRGFDQNGGISHRALRRPQTPSGSPPHQTLWKTTNPREALKPPRSLEMLRGHRGEGKSNISKGNKCITSVEI